VIAETPTEWWDAWHGTRVHARGPAYERLKSAIEQKMLRALFNSYPQCEGKVRSVSSGTPLSTQHYLYKERGESYGLKPTPALFSCQEEWLQPRLGCDTPCHGGGIDGLYLAGQDVNFDGFAGATLGGLMAAAAVDGIGVWLDVLFRAVGVKGLLMDLAFGAPDMTERYRAARRCRTSTK
jgi:all-trans-retinol 13,14-reductase